MLTHSHSCSHASGMFTPVLFCWTPFPSHRLGVAYPGQGVLEDTLDKFGSEACPSYLSVNLNSPGQFADIM